MAKDFSFDIECKFDMQEVKNAVDQAKREIQTRYDFKNVFVEINLSDEMIVLTTESDYKIEAVKQVLVAKLVKRNQSPKILDWSSEPKPTSGMKVRQEIGLIKALETDQVKQISKMIKNSGRKVKSSIQGESVRVSSTAKDELQNIMQLIRSSKEIDAPISFVNFR